MNPTAFLLIISFFFFLLKLVNFIACALKDLQNVFIQYSPLYTSGLFSMLLNNDAVGIEKPYGMCSLTFAVDEFSELLLYSSDFSIIHSRSA